MTEPKRISRSQWVVLAAAFLGWMFDGVEIGLFPLVVRPAFLSLGLADDTQIAGWISRVTAAFLLGAASGGIVFGWLGDKIGRVRSMVIAILIYSLFTGACALAQAPWQLVVFRFIASLGMGGEWALAVALVMECWPERHRPRLAGAIGAAANFGFLFIAAAALVKSVTADSWRWLMIVGAAPAVLALLISMFVPESERWKQSVRAAREKAAGRITTRPLSDVSAWVAFCAALAVGLTLMFALLVWFERASLPGSWAAGGWCAWLLPRLGALAVLLAVACAGGIVARRPAWFLPISGLALLHGLAAWFWRGDLLLLALAVAFLAGSMGAAGSVQEIFSSGLRKSTLLAIVFSAVPLIGTWAAVSAFIPTWVDQTTQIEAGWDALDAAQREAFDKAPDPKAKIALLKRSLPADEWKQIGANTARSKAWVQFVLAIGAIIGCFVAPVIGGIWGRRPVYFALCLVSFLSCQYLFWCLHSYNLWFVLVAGFVGGATAAFYGWLPLYLPELFPTRVRATGQGLSFNFGRVVAALGTFTMGYLVTFFGGHYGKAMGVICLIYCVGMVLIWLAPETKGKPLPE